MPLSIPKTLCLCGALLMSMVSLSHAGWVVKDKLTAYPAIAKEKFGCSITTDGNWLAVGASDTAIVGFRSTGAVHLFERVGDQWFLRQVVQLIDGVPRRFVTQARAFRGASDRALFGDVPQQGNALGATDDVLAEGGWQGHGDTLG